MTSARSISYQWDIPAMFKAAGGPAKLVQLLAENQIEPPRDKAIVYKWSSRAEIPARWLPTIVYLLLKTKAAQLHEIMVEAPHADATFRRTNK